MPTSVGEYSPNLTEFRRITDRHLLYSFREILVAMGQIAQYYDMEVFATVSSEVKKDLIIEQYGIREGHIFYSRDTSFVKRNQAYDQRARCGCCAQLACGRGPPPNTELYRAVRTLYRGWNHGYPQQHRS